MRTKRGCSYISTVFPHQSSINRLILFIAFGRAARLAAILPSRFVPTFAWFRLLQVFQFSHMLTPLFTSTSFPCAIIITVRLGRIAFSSTTSRTARTFRHLWHVVWSLPVLWPCVHPAVVGIFLTGLGFLGSEQLLFSCWCIFTVIFVFYFFVYLLDWKIRWVTPHSHWGSIKVAG